MVGDRQPVRVLDGEQLFSGEAVRGFVQIEASDLLFGQISCRLQESDVESREAVVVARYSKPHELNQLGGD